MDFDIFWHKCYR